MVNFTPWVCIIASAIIACTFVTLPTAYSNEIVSPLTENQYQLQFIDFVKNHKKQYEVTEFFERFNIFKENLDWIREFNSNPDKTQTVGVNFFADLKPSEWNRFMGFKAPEDYKEPNYKAMEDLDLSDIPELKEVYSKYTTDDAPQTLDWVKEGDAMPIRNQGQCGSCFSFSSVATMESLYLINQNKTNDTSVSDDVLGHFSTQEPVDCAWGSPYYCQGCNGGFPASVMYFVRDNGICLDKDYPYEGVTGYCRMNDCKSVYKVDGAVDVSGYSELVMARAAAVNPLAIAITAQAREFMYYKSGIINYCSVYTTTQPDHAVAIYGYNLTHPVKYWTIRNSWGTNWGEDGYVRFRFGGNVCKIRYNVHYPIVKDAKTPVLDRELTLNTDNTPLPIENTPIV